MTSSIDATKPTQGTATTQSVRDNFSAAKTEINDFQRFTKDIVTSSGTDTILATYTNTPGSLYEGLRVAIKAANSNTGPATLNVNSLGSRTIVRKDGTALQAEDITAGGYYEFVYDLTNTRWVLINSDAGKREYPPEFIQGLGFTISTTSTTDDSVTVATGACTDTNNAYDIDITSAIKKDITATWAAGTAAGGYSDQSSAVAGDTRYNVYALTDASDLTQVDIIIAENVSDALADTAALAANFDTARHIGYVRTNAAGTAIRDAWRVTDPSDTRRLIDKWTPSSGDATVLIDLTGLSVGDIEIEINNVLPTTNNSYFYINFGGASDTPTDTGSNYRYTSNVHFSSDSPLSASSATSITIGGASSQAWSNASASAGLTVLASVKNMTSASRWTGIFWHGGGSSHTSNPFFTDGHGHHEVASADTKIEFQWRDASAFVSNNFATAGVIKVYELVDA